MENKDIKPNGFENYRGILIIIGILIISILAFNYLWDIISQLV